MKRIERLRNIGVLAHVDAGKTTLSERLLFAAGRIHRMGEVHHGASALDWREVERRRGVTVSAAATRFDWGGHRVALLDTPGHVDFTQEVERALLAIDGAVVLFSAVAGVEPQTETVWAQADRFRLPRIGFVNKMDAAGADFPRVLSMAAERLGAAATAIQWPVLDEDGALLGLLDLVAERWLTWPEGRDPRDPAALSPVVSPVPKALASEAAARREALVEAVMERGAPEDAVLAAYLDGRALEPGVLKALLRRACLSGGLTPVLAGAAYRGIGVTPLLDAVADLLPSPLDRGAMSGVEPTRGEPVSRRPDPEEPFSALVSKVSVSRFGPLATLRVMSGRLQAGDRLRIAATGESERAGRVLAPHAGETVEIASAEAGEIVAVAGLKSVQAGDSLCDPAAPIAFAGLTRPEPALEAAVEPVAAADQARLGPALAALCREDPSLRVRQDPESGALLLAGMGELHLQVALESLASERGVCARIGRPRVAYRETITRPATVDHTLRKQSGGPGQFARLTLRLEPLGPESVVEGFVFEDRTTGGAVPAEFVSAVEQAVRGALTEGPLAGCPALGLKAVLLDGAHHPVDSSAMAFANAARAAFREAYAEAGARLLEPLTRLEIRAPEARLGAVIADLRARRGAVTGVEPAEGGGAEALQRIEAEAPLAALWGYADALRSLTQGRGQASLGAVRYAPAPAEALEALRREASR